MFCFTKKYIILNHFTVCKTFSYIFSKENTNYNNSSFNDIKGGLRRMFLRIRKQTDLDLKVLLFICQIIFLNLFFKSYEIIKK